MRSVITRRDKVHAYRAKIQSRFSRKQRLERKIFILYFRLLFSRRITPFPLVPPVTNHPVYIYYIFNILCTRTEPKFKVDFLENKDSNEKFLFYIFDFFFRVESPPFRLYHQLPTILYIFIICLIYLLYMFVMWYIS